MKTMTPAQFDALPDREVDALIAEKVMGYTPTAEEMRRFMGKVKKTDTCWLWTGCKLPRGYGQFWFRGKKMVAHRFLLKRHLPEGSFALHKCDTPACVRPSHIFIGSRTDNMRDCSNKGRLSTKGLEAMKGRPPYRYKGQEQPNSKLTAKQVNEIKKYPKHYGSAIKLAKKFGVSQSLVCRIRDGKAWKHMNRKENK